MSFTITRSHTVPDSDLTFIRDLDHSDVSVVLDNIQAMIDAGNTTQSLTTSSDGLTRTRTFTFTDLNAVGTFLTVMHTPVSHDTFYSYAVSNPGYTSTETINLGDIPTLFTTEYAFPANTNVNWLISILGSTPNVVNLSVHTDSITVVHSYPNDAILNEFRWNDHPITSQLVSNNISKTTTVTNA